MAPDRKIITCKQWKARPPKAAPILVGKPDKIVFHHTNGHAPGSGAIPDAGYARATAYARDLQFQHMEINGWNDSGHNFLVMRSGLILQGRWGTVSAIEHGRMVVSAHCPGQNGNPGIEHEHLPGELMTPEQVAATVALMAWICDRTGINPTAIYPHGQFYPTECPSNLTSDILSIRLKVAGKLTYYGRNPKPKARRLTAKAALRQENRS